MMINVLSIRASLAFAPYLAESALAFLREGAAASRVVRQGGGGMIIRSEDELILRHQNREASLGAEDARHYSATIEFRRESYDVMRLSGEVVIASVGKDLFLSHPQSELWLEVGTVSKLLEATDQETAATAELPDWLSISAGNGGLLLSDQRNARWVLLGADHIAELRRRYDGLASAGAPVRQAAPPTFSVKGVTVHLQSAFKLAETLKTYAETGEVIAFEEITPTFHLSAKKSSQGLELRDSQNVVGLNSRDARKWETIITGKLTALHAEQLERGKIRTIFADGDRGRWVLQWGDEVLAPDELLLGQDISQSTQPSLAVASKEGFLLLLEQAGGNCVALTQSEAERLPRNESAHGY